MKKGLIIVGITILVGVVIGVVLMTTRKPTREKEFDTVITSTVTMDINPSIELKLNKENEVVKVNLLNEDSKRIFFNVKLEKESINKAVSLVIDTLKSNDYLSKEKNMILINVVSENKGLSNLVQKEVEKKIEKEEIKLDVVMQEVEETEELKKIAEENGISVSKAYYIEEQIKDSKISIKDIKDLSLEEIETKVEESTKKEEEKKTTTAKKETTSNNNTSTKTSSGDRKGTAKKSYQDLLNEGLLEGKELEKIFLEKHGITKGNNYYGATFSAISDSRCEYNLGMETTIIETFYKHTAIMCQMDGKILDYKKTALVDSSKIISEDEAWNILVNDVLNTKGFDREEINDYSRKVYMTYQDNAPHSLLYVVQFTTKTQGEYVANIDPITKSFFYKNY